MLSHARETALSQVTPGFDNMLVNVCSSDYLCNTLNTLAATIQADFTQDLGRVIFENDISMLDNSREARGRDQML